MADNKTVYLLIIRDSEGNRKVTTVHTTKEAAHRFAEDTDAKFYDIHEELLLG